MSLSTTLSAKSLLLPPRSGPETRLCTLGEPETSSRPGAVTLPVPRGDPHSFATLALVIPTLCPLCTNSVQRKALENVLGAVTRVRTTEKVLATHRSLDSAALASRGALAALRRITRESTEIAVITDRAARVLAEILVRPKVQCVVVPWTDEIDRPSLKALARACLLARMEDAPVWDWHVSAPPDGTRDSGGTVDRSVLDREVRAEMLRTVFAILNPSRRSNGAAHSPPGSAIHPVSRPSEVGIACNWLSTQNYDAAIRWAIECLGHEPNVDALRVFAVAATNTGRHELAVEAFNEAYSLSKKPTMRAHLCAMQALIVAKRKFDLAESQRWYEQGLREIARSVHGDDGDPAVEEAWIYNGLALNTLLKARLVGRPIGTAFDDTFALLRRGFKLVEQGESSDRVYLRYNLLGNMSAFMSIQGEHRIALDLFERAFDASLTEGLADAVEWQAVLATRRAGLYASAGETETALGLYRDAVGILVETDRPVCAESVRRSVGILGLQLGRASEAEVAFRKGLDEALKARSMAGAKVHGAGLINALARQGRICAAADVLQSLAEDQGVWLSDQGKDPLAATLSVPAPTRLVGLSTSIPEIDLENLEPVGISTVLSSNEVIPHVAA